MIIITVQILLTCILRLYRKLFLWINPENHHKSILIKLATISCSKSVFACKFKESCTSPGKISQNRIGFNMSWIKTGFDMCMSCTISTFKMSDILISQQSFSQAILYAVKSQRPNGITYQGINLSDSLSRDWSFWFLVTLNAF